MRNQLMLTGLALTAVAVAACGGSTPPGTPPSPSGLAARIGCTGYASTSATLFAREEGGCTLDGDNLDIATFSTTANEDDWIKTASGFGGIIVEGTLWAVGTGTQASAQAITANLGGSVAS